MRFSDDFNQLAQTECVEKKENKNRNTEWILPLDGLVLDFGYLVFNQCHHLAKDFVLSSLVAQEVVGILFDFVHQVVKAHETQTESEYNKRESKGMGIPKVLVWRLHLGTMDFSIAEKPKEKVWHLFNKTTHKVCLSHD